MKITLPLPPNMANSRMHWRVKQKEKTAYYEACDTLLRAGLTPKESPKMSRVRLGATIYCGGRMDEDNAVARLKWPVDWMVMAEYLSGDGRKHLAWHWPIEQVVKRNQEYRVEFELSEAA